MIATASAVIARDGRLEHVSSQPPLTLRRLHHADRGTCALGLVGSAAGPLAGDELNLNLDVAPGARATLAAAGASIAQGRAGAPACVRTMVTVGAGGSLEAEPGPMIVCDGASVQVWLELDVAADAELSWREVLVLGRTGEPGGSAVLHWNVTRGGQPLLRQTLDLSERGQTTWSGAVGRHRVITTELRIGAFDAATIIHSRTDVTQRIADGATLRTTLA
jgi:urease accessory protein